MQTLKHISNWSSWIIWASNKMKNCGAVWFKPRSVTESEMDFKKFFISLTWTWYDQWSFLLWFQAAQKLENGKMLAPCPRCSLPSQVDVVSHVGQCTHKNCQYLFCSTCHCDIHIGSSCPFSALFPQSRKRPSCIGSKASKKNLRRLWVTWPVSRSRTVLCFL